MFHGLLNIWFLYNQQMSTSEAGSCQTLEYCRSWLIRCPLPLIQAPLEPLLQRFGTWCCLRIITILFVQLGSKLQMLISTILCPLYIVHGVFWIRFILLYPTSILYVCYRLFPHSPLVRVYPWNQPLGAGSSEIPLFSQSSLLGNCAMKVQFHTIFISVNVKMINIIYL